jgi:hypothetical protein
MVLQAVGSAQVWTTDDRLQDFRTQGMGGEEKDGPGIYNGGYESFRR